MERRGPVDARRAPSSMRIALHTFTVLLLTSSAMAKDSTASAHYEHGVQLSEDGDYEQALQEMQAAYDVSPKYQVLYNIALLQLELGRLDEAASTFDRYLRDGGTALDPGRVDAVLARLARLRPPPVATVPVSVPKPTLPVDPPRKRRGWFVGGAAVGAVGAGAALSVLAMNHAGAYRRAVDVEPGDPVVITHERWMAMRLARTADVMFGVAGAMGVTAGVLLVIDRQREVKLSPTSVLFTGRF